MFFWGGLIKAFSGGEGGGEIKGLHTRRVPATSPIVSTDHFCFTIKGPTLVAVTSPTISN